MDADNMKGYQLETCSGPNGCKNRAIKADGLPRELEKRLCGKDPGSFLKEKVKGPLKIHHAFRVSLSECPNACSRPQIVDVGLIGASRPVISNEACSQCGTCRDVCREEAIDLPEEGSVTIENSRCLLCGKCIEACPTGTIQEGPKGYRVLVGGKLGRHPRLGTELAGIYEQDQVPELLDACLDYYERNCTRGERFGEILEKKGLVGLNGMTKKRKKRSH